MSRHAFSATKAALMVCVVLLGSGRVASAANIEFDAAIGKKGTGRCHMDTCSFFQIETAIPVAVLRDGTLFAVSELSWGATYKAHGDADEHEYDRPPVATDPKRPDAFVVFCSKTRPHIFFYDAGKWVAAALRPGDEAAVFGATESAYNSYWAACHHFIAQDPTSAKMAAKFGYRFRGGFPDRVDDPIKQPMDLLKEAR